MTDASNFIEAMMHEYDWLDVTNTEYLVIADRLIHSWSACYGNTLKEHTMLSFDIDTVRIAIEFAVYDFGNPYGKTKDGLDVISTVEAFAFLFHMRPEIESLLEDTDEVFLMDATDFAMSLDIMRHVMDTYIDRQNINRCTDCFNDEMQFLSSDQTKSLVENFMNTLQVTAENIENNDRKMA